VTERLDYDCVVIGGGPGGLTAALYLGRYKRTVCLVHGGIPRAHMVPKIHNLAGDPEGLSGRELLRRLRRQVARLLVDFVPGEAKVSRRGKHFLVEVGERRLRAAKVILATGIEDVQPPFPNAVELCERGLLGYCPICDGFDHSGEKVALLVRDEHGLDKIPFLAKFSPNLHVVCLEPGLKLPPRCRRVADRLRVRVYRSEVTALVGRRRHLEVRFRGRAPLRVSLAYVALGARVRDEAFRGIRGLKRTKEGYLQVSYHQETTVPGLFAVGDCVNALAQVNVAAGQAAVAATRVHNDLG
jgi:thioredoxin reductase (NADPH)